MLVRGRSCLVVTHACLSPSLPLPPSLPPLPPSLHLSLPISLWQGRSPAAVAPLLLEAVTEALRPLVVGGEGHGSERRLLSPASERTATLLLELALEIGITVGVTGGCGQWVWSANCMASSPPSPLPAAIPPCGNTSGLRLRSAAAQTIAIDHTI